jgi:hypothetical protein
VGVKVLCLQFSLLQAADFEHYSHNFSNRAGLVAV